MTKAQPESQPGEGREAGKASHGAPSEVSWNSGAGRQPYANQGAEEAAEPEVGDHVSEGNRGELSGRNQEQLEKVRKLP
jgi:hypothetical protein